MLSSAFLFGPQDRRGGMHTRAVCVLLYEGVGARTRRMPSSVACSGLSDSGEGEKEWAWCERERRTIRGRGGKNGKRKGAAAPLPSFLPFFSCLRFHNSADPTISEPETAYLLGSLKRPASPPEGWLYAGWLKKSQRYVTEIVVPTNKENNHSQIKK